MVARIERLRRERKLPPRLIVGELAQDGIEVSAVEGVTCTRREASPYLAYTVWVDAPADQRLSRGLSRDGSDHLEVWQRWMTWEDRFFAEDRTRERADLRVDGYPMIPHNPRTHLVTG